MTFGEKLLQLRKEHGLSQEELAEQLNVSRQAISRWEAGNSLPDTVHVVKLSKLFAVTTDYLLHDEYTSDRDIPFVRYTENAIKQEHDRKRTFWILVGVQIFGCFWGLYGWLTFGAIYLGLSALLINLGGVIVFEILRHRDEIWNRFRARYYRIAIWLSAYFPVRLMVIAMWQTVAEKVPAFLWGEGEYLFTDETLVQITTEGQSLWLGEGSVLLVYLLVCLTVTWILRERNPKQETKEGV